jgi:hypothetical protein
MLQAFFGPLFVLYWVGIWVTVSLTYRLSKVDKDWRGFPALVSYALCWMSWFGVLNILVSRAFFYVLDNLETLADKATGFFFGLATKPDKTLKDVDEYVKAGKVEVIPLVVGIILKLLGLK